MTIKGIISQKRIEKVREKAQRQEGVSAPSAMPAALGSLPVFAGMSLLAAALGGIEFILYRIFVPGLLPNAGATFNLFPFVIVPLLLGMLYGPVATVATGLFTTLFLWFVSGLDPCTLAVAATSTVVSALYAPHIKSFRNFWKLLSHQLLGQALVGVVVMCVQRCFLSASHVTPQYVIAQLVFLAALSLLAGPLALYVFLPAAEKITGRISDFSMMPFANVGGSLLQRLSREAPGTYHHSLMVADLSQAAADAIGANGLLARIGGYYHDIGKLSKPEYFMENQTALGNPHDALPPSVSRMVIAAHVKEGAILARDAKLPAPVVRIIESHHGTTNMQWFKLKAEKNLPENAGRHGAESLSEFFRYPGPLPQTREETVVSIADSVEAASRSLKSPDGNAIASLVNGIVAAKYADGQFARSVLSLAELQEVSNSLITTLSHGRHVRKAYPPKKDALA